MEPKGIHAAMAAIGREIPAVAKSSKNSHQGWTYRSADAFMNAIHPIAFKHGVYLTVSNIEKLVWERDAKNWTHCVLKVEYTWMHEDGSTVPCTGFGEAKDNGDKVVGKCLTYALKTMLQTVFIIPTEDTPDPDAEVAPPTAPSPERKETGIYQSMPNQKKALASLAKSIKPEITHDQLRFLDKHCQGVAITGLKSKIEELLK